MENNKAPQHARQTYSLDSCPILLTRRYPCFTRAINQSLLALKECIRARTAASQPSTDVPVHVPYRRSKLTLLMKDVFEVWMVK